MIKLNDYLYNGDTIFRILQKYSDDLRQHAIEADNPVDMTHCNFLLQLMGVLEHNDFLSAQSMRIHEFYSYLAKEYPYLSFIFKGRIKSLIRAEEKFNGYLVSFIYNYYYTFGVAPPVSELRDRVTRFRDLIAYRIVISLPRCQSDNEEERRKKELALLYEIAGKLPPFLEARGFTPEKSSVRKGDVSELMEEQMRPFYKDFVANPSENGYQSLHVTFYDNMARCYVEVQLRTKEMDDNAEIGAANHFGYEQMQERERARRDAVPEGKNLYFDEAYERGMALQGLNLKNLDVNMFTAYDNYRINDCCGLLKGRLILPFEHLSRFQSD